MLQDHLELHSHLVSHNLLELNLLHQNSSKLHTLPNQLYNKLKIHSVISLDQAKLQHNQFNLYSLFSQCNLHSSLTNQILLNLQLLLHKPSIHSHKLVFRTLILVSLNQPTKASINQTKVLINQTKVLINRIKDSTNHSQTNQSTPSLTLVRL